MGQYNLNVTFPPNCRGKYHEFIGAYKNFLSPAVCSEIVEKFNQLESIHQIAHNSEGKKIREDYSLDLSQMMLNSSAEIEVQAALFTAFSEYRSIFSELNGLYHTTFKKVQKTLPGGGYHFWHCENVTFTHSNRILAWMIYLNDITEGGETEFLYQSVRYKPSAGDLLLWPASFTHLHRGNPPLSETKYVLTGWFQLNP